MKLKQLSISELDLISVLIGTCLGLELAKLTPDNEKIAQLNKLNGTIILMKTGVNYDNSTILIST